MFLEKDERSKFDFISIKEFISALTLIFLSIIFSYLILPYLLKEIFPNISKIFNTHYLGIFVFTLSSFLNGFIIYYFCCKRKNKSFKDGLFFYNKTKKTYLISILIGIVVPILTLPIILKFAPKEFYAMDIAKTKEGIIYLGTCALTAPIFEELFFRGFIFPFFQSKTNSHFAVIITALFFGFAHLINIGNAHILFGLFIFYGFVLTLIRYFTNSLIPPMITHFVHNLTLMVSFLVLSRS